MTEEARSFYIGIFSENLGIGEWYTVLQTLLMGRDERKPQSKRVTKVSSSGRAINMSGITMEATHCTVKM